MNTQGISGSDGWSKFMKLTQEARVRNQAFAGQAKSVAPAKKTAISGPLSYAPMVNRNTFSSGAVKPETRILGGQFDAYA